MQLCGTFGRFTATNEGVENVLIEDVDGGGPFANVQRNAGGVRIADDGDALLVIE